MNRLLRGAAVAVALFAGGLTALPARAAEEAGAMKVDDAAGLFSADGISKAKEAFHGTTFHSPTHLLVVTANSIPESKKADFNEAKGKADTRKQFFVRWAREVGNAKDRKGDVVVLLYHTDKNYFAETVTDEQSDRFRHFGDKKAQDVSKVFSRAMEKLHEKKPAADDAKKEMDTALASATEIVISELKDTSAPEPRHKAGGHEVAADNHREGRGVGGWLCIAACVLLGVWLVTALIRAFTGGGGGGGYGGGGYGGGGGGYGGGGGGFFSSLLGGMFGAAAGMWMYNNLFGGSSYYNNDAMAGGDNYGNDGVTDTGDGNYEGGAEGGEGGGDWGDSGGGDAGGGDWGGGGDAGGGDWGGGGGDFGGGGGDFGGGGGDW